MKNGFTNYLMSYTSIDDDSVDYYKPSFHFDVIKITTKTKTINKKRENYNTTCKCM